MTIPNIRYYACLTLCTDKGKSTPKYRITASAGYYEPMTALIGADHNISFYLLEKLREGDNIPSVWLQGKNSLNFTGLKEYFDDNGKLNGNAYGYPYQSKTYSTKKRANPFYEYRNDGYLFIIHQDTASTVTDEEQPQQITPTSIELLVLEGAKSLISSYCKMLAMGGFDDTITQLRTLAKE
ncbi:MAG: hypothetical protein LUD48_02190 [Prevotella sp.]|nr:hypothetical protein [Prevotella sp.]